MRKEKKIIQKVKVEFLKYTKSIKTNTEKIFRRLSMLRIKYDEKLVVFIVKIIENTKFFARRISFYLIKNYHGRKKIFAKTARQTAIVKETKFENSTFLNNKIKSKSFKSDIDIHYIKELSKSNIDKKQEDKSISSNREDKSSNDSKNKKCINNNNPLTQNEEIFKGKRIKNKNEISLSQFFQENKNKNNLTPCNELRLDEFRDGNEEDKFNNDLKSSGISISKINENNKEKSSYTNEEFGEESEEKLSIIVSKNKDNNTTIFSYFQENEDDSYIPSIDIDEDNKQNFENFINNQNNFFQKGSIKDFNIKYKDKNTLSSKLNLMRNKTNYDEIRERYFYDN